MAAREGQTSCSPSLSSSEKRRMGDSFVPVCRVVGGIGGWTATSPEFLGALRNIEPRDVEKGRWWGSRSERVTLNGGWGKADLIHANRSHAFRTRRAQFWVDNHERRTRCTRLSVNILISDKLTIPLYQSNPHDNSVRKNVRGRAAMGVLLSLLNKLGLDFLSPGNLAEQISGIKKG